MNPIHLLPIKLFIVLQISTLQSLAQQPGANSSGPEVLENFVPLLNYPRNHRMDPNEKVTRELDGAHNQLDGQSLDQNFFAHSEQNLFEPKHTITPAYKQFEQPKWSASYQSQSMFRPPTNLTLATNQQQQQPSVAFDDELLGQDLSSFSLDVRRELENSGSMSLGQARRALEENLALQDKLLTLLNRAKSSQTATTAQPAQQVASADQNKSNQQQQQQHVSLEHQHQQTAALMQPQAANLISLRQSDQLMRGIVPANNLVRHPPRRNFAAATAAAKWATTNNGSEHNRRLLNLLNHYTPTGSQLASPAGLIREEPLLTSHEERQVQRHTTTDYGSSDDDDTSGSRPGYHSGAGGAGSKQRSSRPMLVPNLIKDLQFGSNPATLQSANPSSVAAPAASFSRLDEYPIKLMNNFKRQARPPGPLLQQQRRRVNPNNANDNSVVGNQYQLASTNQRLSASLADDLNFMDDTDNLTDDLDSPGQRLGQGYAKSFYGDPDQDSPAEHDDEGAPAYLSLPPSPVQPRRPMSGSHWSSRDPDASSSHQAKRNRLPLRRPHQPTRQSLGSSRGRNRQLIDAGWFSPLVASSLVESGELRHASPSHQVVHIHDNHGKDKKGKYLWPIVGGALTMLMGFLIISNMLLSIPLLAIGASSLFNHNSPYSQQLVPVYNLSQIVTTRAPNGRRRRRRQAATRTRAASNTDSLRRWDASGPDRPLLRELEARLKQLVDSIVKGGGKTIVKAGKLAYHLGATSRLFGGMTRRQVLKAAYCRLRPIRQQQYTIAS